MKLRVRHSSLLVALLFAALSVAAPSFASALSGDQKALYRKNILYYDLESCESASISSTLLIGSSNEEKVWNYFKGKGLDDHLVAGIMGNIAQESGFDPEIIQGGARTKDPSGISDGWGLIQWTPGSKILGIAKEAKIDGPIYELATQLDIVWWHLTEVSPTGYTNALPEFKKAQTAKDAATAWEELIEGAGDPQMPDRWAAAEAALQKYGGQGPAGEGSAASSESCECAISESGQGVNAKLDKLSKENGGKTQISVSSLDGAVSGNVGGDAQMPTRSSYKIYTAYATLKAIEDGKISWGSSTSWGRSVSQTMEAMIVNSDNEAAEALRTDSRIGNHQKVTQLLQGQVGLSDKTIMGSGNSTSPAGTNSKSTANDFTKFLLLLGKKKLPEVNKADNYNKLLDFMKRATTDGQSARAGIAAGVGPGVEVADKPGWAPVGVDPASNDVGIVYAEQRTYVVAILTDEPDRWDGVAKIAKEVHGLMGGGSPSQCSSEFSGDLSATIKAFAWPDYHPAPYGQQKAEYKKAVDEAQGKGMYVGGTAYPGNDCGGFVTLAMINSGFEPNYNYTGKGGATGSSPSETGTQWGWLDANWKKINPSSTRDLQAGDVAINSSHTYMYAGKIPGFNSNIASASWDSGGGPGRAPMAGHEAPADPSFTWYRKK